MSFQGVTDPSRRTHQPVRRNSRLAGREGVFWRPTSRREAQRVLYGAKRFDRVHRPFGSRTGPLGGVAIEVLELLTRLVSFKSGQLDPSLETIMRHCHRSRDAVVRALAALRRHGFLDWLRRYVAAEGAGARGPQVKQTSNAYRLALPARAAALVGRWFDAPPPLDDADRRNRLKAEAEAQERAESPLFASLERWRLAIEATPGGQRLAEAAETMRQRGKERESAERTESRN